MRIAPGMSLLTYKSVSLSSAVNYMVHVIRDEAHTSPGISP